ncbi:SICAvar, type I [Plasmodium knowlesi strain H]|uniref:SICAvar, type I n=3 Tax=Plasmodium knowlesi TaxID=5850 RepID=A0A1A7VZP0_PLAKH|nr:SICAvar, type I [Plasmodium knowlesi strain H]OTN68679.1 SICAvar type I [Plasmodium knowlesi]CAA9986112.1 SICAvar, type I [Plasmodium knowlesi strain H]SBO25276.1 SICAvar, type I [Plasmodium knowlesi strain H]SBO27608.1 SICAvar, type I [Plasmodium knowlesi strain H]VVS75586.1 SICAvar, type I [Plasmodium knowlesi strain H]
MATAVAGGVGGAGGGGGGGGNGGRSSSLMEAWLEKLKGDGELSGSAEEITTKLKKNLEDEWEELKTSLEQPGSTEISSLCASVGSLVEGVWTDQKEAYLKNLCKGIVEIKYFMSGVETKREDKGRGGKDETAQIKQLTDAQAYPRCIVGSVALNELYGDHCKLDGIIGEISTTMNNKLRGYPTQNGQSAEDQLNKCQGITKEQLFIGKSIIGNTIKLWAEGDRAKEERKKSRDQTGGALRVGYVWRYWPNVCGGKGKQKEEQHLRELRRNNAKHMMSFLTVGDDNMSSGADTDGKPTLGEILTDDSYTVEKDQLNSVLSVLVEGSTGEVDTSKLPTLMQTLETISKETKAQECIQNNKDNVDNNNSFASTGKLCNRLQCIQNYLNTTGTTPAGKAAEAALWNDVQTQVTKLATTVSNNVGSDSDADGLCKDVKCPNDGEEECVSKTTCNIMAKALKEVYKKGEADQEDYRIFYPTLRCVILNAFADKLKDRANEGGYACAVEEGIEGAFAAAQEKNKYKEWCNGNGKNDGSCQPCGKQHQVCTAYSIKGTTSLVSKVMNELNKNTTNIQKTLSEISNKVSLCDRMNCIIKQWIDNNTSGATTPGAATTRGVSTTNTDQFWGEKGDVMKLWNELAKKMKETNGKVNGQCDLFATDAEKWACKYLHAGFTELKSISSSITTNAGAYETLHKDPSFVQTMGCFLLHSYAKYMKDKATCNIEKGITQAFESWNVSSNGNCSGTEPCVPCQWNGKDHESCTIKTNGSTDPNYKVEEKLKDIVNEDKDTKIKEMLSNINKRTTLCDHMKCIASHLSSTNGQQKQSNTSADEFWGEAGDVKNLWKKLVEEMKENGKTDQNECNQVNDNGTKRDAIHSEKTACNYLHVGFTKLKDITESINSKSNDYPTLHKDPSFAQTVGCFLLHSYAEHMEKKSTCVITAGIEKAFTTAGKIGSDVTCQWNKSDYEKCKINTNGGSGIPTQTEVKNKLKEIVTENDPKIKTMAEAVNKMDLCDQVKCVAARWRKEKDTSGSPPRDWKKVWEGEDGVKKELGELSKKMKEKTDAASYCTMDEGKGKEACLLIAAGLKNLYNTTTADDLTASFQRTMQCVLLNAIADKLESDELPCKDEKSVQAGINHAFGTENDNIRSGVSTCKDDVKCFKCVREKNLMSCTLNNDDKNVKEKVEPMLKANDTFKKESLEKTICKPCTGEGKKDFCQELNCVVDKWGERKNGSSSGTTTWDDMKSDLEKELNSLLSAMKTNQTAVVDHCNNSDWKKDDAAGDANKTACKLVAAGLQHISKIQESHSTIQHKPYDNQEFKQLVSCLMLKAVVQKMKEDSKICDIEPGIRVAFAKAGTIKTAHCKNDKPCIVCNWSDGDYNQLNNCKIGTGNINVKDKLDSLLKETKHQTKVEETLQDLLKTDKSDTLCPRLQCLASKVKLSGNEDKFWTNDGDVGNLWKELAKEMNTKGTEEQSSCSTVDTSRTPTDPERRACNHLTAGFNQLKKDPTSNGSDYPILKDNRLLRQTVGCFLLKEYAKQLQKDSKCVIEAGLKKAFQNNKSSCTNNASCIECEWDENLENCDLKIGSDNKKLNEKFNELLKQNKDNNLEENLKKINHMDNLCDYIKCAAPKWFHNQNNSKAGSTGNPTKTWCDFWDTTVKDALEEMFKEIDQNGKDKSKTNKNVVCKAFGDDNPNSVERKACNHITAGLEYIKNITGSGSTTPKNGHQDDDKFFKQSMMCAALNLYADKIKEQTDNICPIDEKRIEKMFDDWNKQNNPNSSPSPSCKSGVYDCFVCKRDDKILDGCNLLVDKGLIGKSTPSQPKGNCNDNDENKKVQEKMTNLLQTEPKMDETLMNINEMKSSFCTQVQCAIKKKLRSNNVQTPSTGTTQPWNALSDEIGKELTELLKDMNDAKKQSDAAKYCNDDNLPWNTKGHTERRTNRAACLHFAAGLKHIYGHGNGHVNGRSHGQQGGHVNGPSFEQTMGCLFLKEYAKQLQKVAEVKKQGNSWVHPYCEIDKGINYAFSRSENIMKETSPCKDTNGTNDCFVCIQKEDDYNNCKIGNDDIGNEATEQFKNESKQKLMQETLENTVCPILITDLLTPFLPLAPVSIGLSAMAYYLWKYFGPLGKGGQRFRRSPAEIPGPSVQEQLLDHVQQDSSHEYRLVKERKPRSAPTRTKRSGPVNRRTIIEIHFEVLDECQKGDTQLNQKDFLELLVQEFMGSEFIEEEQVPKEEVPMESLPMERVSIKEVPSLGSGLMV